MPAITIRDIPDDVLVALQAKAARSELSLHTYLRDLVTRDAAIPILRESVARMRDIASADLSDIDVSTLIHEGHERR